MTLSYEEGRERDRKSARDSARLAYHVQRDEAMDAYGGKCVVCGHISRTDLMIVPRRGYRWTVERCGRKVRSGRDKMRWLQKNQYPDDFTLVCSRQRDRKCWIRLQTLVDSKTSDTAQGSVS